MCVSRFHNKGVYVKAGLQKLSHTRNLHQDIRLQVDKHEVELPSIEGLIFLNIPRYTHTHASTHTHSLSCTYTGLSTWTIMNLYCVCVCVCV